MVSTSTRLERLAPAEYALAARWLSNPSINRWLTSEWRGRAVDTMTIGILVRDRRNLVYLVRHEDTPCGLAALSEIDTVDRVAMVWYLLGEPQYARQGLTARAVDQLVAIAFEELQLASLYAWIMADNTPSRRVLERCGFREAGRIRTATCSGGKQLDRVYFDLVSADARKVA